MDKKNLEQLINKMTKLYIKSESKGVVDKTNRMLLGVVGSSGIIDRQGESLNPMGWILENYQKNPVVLYAHDYGSLPIAKAERVWIEDNKLMFNIKFADTPMAKDVFDLFDGGFLNAFSVGFIPKELDSTGQYTWAKQELLELSVVPVPANPEALTGNKEMSMKFKSIEETFKKEIKKRDIEQKEGRVLSTKNENRIRQADALLNEVLTELDKEEKKEISLFVNKEELRTIIKEEIVKALEGVKIIQEKVVEKIIEVDRKEKETFDFIKNLRDGLRKTDKGVGLTIKTLNDLLKVSSIKGGDIK